MLYRLRCKRAGQHLLLDGHVLLAHGGHGPCLWGKPRMPGGHGGECSLLPVHLLWQGQAPQVCLPQALLSSCGVWLDLAFLTTRNFV